MSPIIDDLRVEIEIPPQTQRPGATVVATLRFSNLGTRPRMLFLITTEAYRFGQSTFHMQTGDGQTIVQPARHAGYEPNATDFHPIGARGRLEFSQMLHLPRGISPGQYTVQWVYENKVATWPGSLTLPGTPPGSQPIPGIWLGKIEDSFRVEVTRVLYDPPGAD